MIRPLLAAAASVRQVNYRNNVSFTRVTPQVTTCNGRNLEGIAPPRAAQGVSRRLIAECQLLIWWATVRPVSSFCFQPRMEESATNSNIWAISGRSAAPTLTGGNGMVSSTDRPRRIATISAWQTQGPFRSIVSAITSPTATTKSNRSLLRPEQDRRKREAVMTLRRFQRR